MARESMDCAPRETRGPSREPSRAAAWWAVCCAATWLGVPARADILYGVQGIAAYQLVRIDTNSLSLQVVGEVGFRIVGLTFTADGSLLGLAAGDDALVEIDPLTGAGTLVGPLGLPVPLANGLDTDPTTGTLYGTTASGFLVTVSHDTGDADIVAQTFTGGVAGMAFDDAGQLYAIDGSITDDHLIQLDKTTGAMTVIGPQGLASYPSIGGFDIGPSGTFWAVSVEAGVHTLLSIDSVTGAPTEVGTLSGPTLGGLNALTSGGPPASCAFRNGSGANAADFTCASAPVLGSTWSSGIELAPSLGQETVATAVLLGLGGSVDGIFVLGGQELLVLPPYRFDTALGAGAGGHALDIPADPVLAGVLLHSQGVRFEQSASLGVVAILLNAQDLILGP